MRISILVAISLVALLAACTSSPPPASPTTSPSPAPTATIDPPSIPVPILGPTCADGIDPASLDAALAGPALPHLVEIEKIAELIAIRQAGGIRCEWWATRADGGSNMFEIAMVPDGVAGFETATQLGSGIGEPEIDTWGDRSTLECSNSTCAFDVLVDDVWISGGISVYATDRGALRASLAGILDEVVHELASAARPAVWSAPDAQVGWGWDCVSPSGEAPVLAVLRAVFDAPGLGSVGSQLDPNSEVQRVQDALSFCIAVEGEYTTTVAAALVVGGSWVVDDVPFASPAGGAFVPTGVDGALVDCSTYCVGLQPVRGSLLILTAAPEDRAVFADRLASVAAGI